MPRQSNRQAFIKIKTPLVPNQQTSGVSYLKLNNGKCTKGNRRKDGWCRSDIGEAYQPFGGSHNHQLDKSEAPIRQLAFISILKRMLEQDTQLIIATHSPIIMAFPNATILSFSSARIQQVDYNDLEHVTLMKAFLNNPEVYLRRL